MTGTGGDNQGKLEVELNIGDGYYTAVPQASFGKGAVVLDACFTTMPVVRGHNSASDAWAGAVSFSTDGGVTYSNGFCTSGCTGDVEVTSIVFDGKNDSSALAPTDCLSGTLCVLEAERGTSFMLNVIDDEVSVIRTHVQ